MSDNEFSADKYGTRKVQEYLLPILLDIDKLCRENDIKYSLAGGCLLGAVRHKGFVPWDDDVDIIFDRGNYDKFLETIKTKLPQEYTLTGSIWVKRITRKDNPRIREEEGCVDLFVFDNVPDNKLFASYKHFCLKLLQGMIKENIKYSTFSFKGKVLSFGSHIIGLPFSKKRKLKMYDNVSQWGNKKKTAKINNYVTYFDMISSMKYDNDLTSDYINADFEGHKVMIFKNYDSALKTQFGDYMTPPPESERIQKHLHKETLGEFN